MNRFRLRISKWWAVTLILLCIAAILTFAVGIPGLERDLENQSTIWATTPTDRRTLSSLQERSQSAIRSASPAVVAIQSSHGEKLKRGAFEGYGSGVLISADGLILSQAHVSHGAQFPSGQLRRQPNERVTVILSDGRKEEAELLGADLTFDLSLLRLLAPGPYPHTPLDPAARINLGDWVLKLGHPLGYRRDRPPVARLGRALFVRSDVFVSDCYLTGGDSGGPFFDLDGRLVGIMGNVTSPMHISDGLTPPDRSRSGPWMSMTNEFIQQRLKRLLVAEVVPLKKAAADEFYNGYHSYRWAKDGMLPRKQWTQGRATVNAFRDVIQESRRSVVAILDENDHVVAHGTIVNADGEIVTLASTLPKKPRCWFSDSQHEAAVAAQIIGIDPEFDLALLRVPVNGWPAIKWTTKRSPEAGTLLASVGTSETALGIGIVSVPQRSLPGPFRTSVMCPIPYVPDINPHDPAAHPYSERPAAFGWIKSKSYLINMAAPTTGLEPGDRLLSVAGRNIKWESDLINSCASLTPGEKVAVCLIRDGRKQQLNADLSPVPMKGSKAYGEFPTLFEHDTPLFMSPLGAPVVDLDGEAIGITVYRSDYGCLAIPGNCIMRLLPNLKTNKNRNTQ